MTKGWWRGDDEDAETLLLCLEYYRGVPIATWVKWVQVWSQSATDHKRSVGAVKTGRDGKRVEQNGDETTEVDYYYSRNTYWH
jgi:hypothetical protein